MAKDMHKGYFTAYMWNKDRMDGEICAAVFKTAKTCCVLIISPSAISA